MLGPVEVGSRLNGAGLVKRSVAFDSVPVYALRRYYGTTVKLRRWFQHRSESLRPE